MSLGLSTTALSPATRLPSTEARAPLPRSVSNQLPLQPIRTALPPKPRLINVDERRVFGETSSTVRSLTNKFKHETGQYTQNATPYYLQGNLDFESEEARAERLALKAHSAEHFRAVVRCYWRSANLRDGDVMLQPRYLEIHRLICMAIAPRMPARAAKRAGQLDWEHDSKGADELSFDGYCEAIFDLADQWCDSTELKDYLHFAEMLYIRITKRIAGAPRDTPTHTSARRAFCQPTEVKALTATLLTRGSSEAAQLKEEELPAVALAAGAAAARDEQADTTESANAPDDGVPAAERTPAGSRAQDAAAFESGVRVLQWYTQLQKKRRERVSERPSMQMLGEMSDLVVAARWAAARAKATAANRLAPIAPSAAGAPPLRASNNAEEAEEEAHDDEVALAQGPYVLPDPAATLPIPPPTAALRIVRKKLQAASYGQRWAALFSKVDRDRSGRLDVDELIALVRRVLRIPPAVMPPVDILDLHAFLDLDSDGSVSVGELHAFLISDDELRPAARPTAATLQDIARSGAEGGGGAGAPAGALPPAGGARRASWLDGRRASLSLIHI